jgi:hypothetical protein
VPASFAFCRRLLLIGAVLLSAVALVIPWAVIPPVRADTWPSATPASAVPAFWIIVFFHVLTATGIGLTATRISTVGRASQFWVLVPLALLVLLSAYALEEPGRAYSREGLSMQAASLVLFACTASDFLAAVLLLAAASLLPRGQSRADRHTELPGPGRWVAGIPDPVPAACVQASGRPDGTIVATPWLGSSMQRTTIGLAVFLLSCGIHPAKAQSPPPDTSPGFFAGEWAGTGVHGSYCYVKLTADGLGWVLIDGGSGDWSGSSIQWRNRQQSLQIDNAVPLHTSAQRRIMPLEDFVLSSEFNQSLSLTWNTPGGSCHLQRIESTANHLSQARSAIAGLPPAEGVR